MKLVLLLLVLLQLFTGCASMNYEAQHESMKSDPDSLGAPQVFEGDIPFESARKVALFTEKRLPRGISLNEEQEIRVSPGSEYEVVEKVYLKIPFINNPYISNGTLWFYSYRPEEGWRKPFCHWQVPLHWVTLGLWSIVPLSWPCRVSIFNIYFSDSSDTKKDRFYLLQQGLKAEALRKKGDAVISVFLTLESQSASGYVLRKRRR